MKNNFIHFNLFPLNIYIYIFKKQIIKVYTNNRLYKQLLNFATQDLIFWNQNYFTVSHSNPK
jgi:hypothetical protein